MKRQSNRKHADVGFNIATGALWGAINGVQLNYRAWSGGFATSKRANRLIVNNPFATHMKSNSKEEVGGPIPLGTYFLKPDGKKRAGWTEIEPAAGTDCLNRTELRIHPKGGNTGSVGCIVLASSEASAIASLVQPHWDRFGVWPTLSVVAVGIDVDWQLREAVELARTA